MAVLIGYPSSSEWDVENIVFPYFFIQFFPLMLIEIESFKIYRLMREASTTRKAELHPRRLFDFITIKMIGIVMFVYFAFIAFIIYINQFEFTWFGGFGNLAAMTAMNLFFALIIIWNMYGKKQDPYQAYEDRRKQIELIVKQMFFISIVATLFIVISVILHALDLRHLNPIVMSLYFQLIAVIALRTLSIDSINFEVYKADLSLESDEKQNYRLSEEKRSHSYMSISLLIGSGLGLLFGTFIVLEGGTVKGFVMGGAIGMILGIVIGIFLDLRKGSSPTI